MAFINLNIKEINRLFAQSDFLKKQLDAKRPPKIHRTISVRKVIPRMDL